MQVIYSLDIETREVKLHKQVYNNEAEEQLITVSQQLLKNKKLYTLSIKTPQCIEVYTKIKHVHYGWSGKSTQYENKHIMNIGITELVSQNDEHCESEHQRENELCENELCEPEHREDMKDRQRWNEHCENERQRENEHHQCTNLCNNTHFIIPLEEHQPSGTY